MPGGFKGYFQVADFGMCDVNTDIDIQDVEVVGYPQCDRLHLAVGGYGLMVLACDSHGNGEKWSRLNNRQAT